MDPGRNRPTPPQLNLNSLVSPSSDNLRRRSLTPITRSFPATIHSLPSYTSSNSPFTDPVPEPELSRGWRALLVARVVGYILTILSLAVTFAISAMFLATSIANYGTYYGANIELLAASLLGLLSLTPMHFVYHRKQPESVLSHLWMELLVLTVVWLLILGGVATMTSQLPSLSSCAGFALCDQARALQSTAWVSWAALSVLMVGLIGVGAGESAGRGDGVWARGFGVVVRAGQREKQ